MKDACTNSTTVRMTLSDLPSTDTGVHKHGTTSTVVETEFQHIPGSKTRLHNLHQTTMTVKTTSSDLPSTETGGHKHRATSGVQKYSTTSTVMEIGLQDIPGTETQDPRDSKDGFIHQ